ncbi:sterol desaturase family protein [Cryptosporangium aurantiacum]|uniref:Sterol desaturase/sphingolipid hydroxylase, fatty acid hydroxylase superfamily n=1 Tax=Cryptosporangium aurantiacum TaxID=134849 RepID=A0A1M7K4C8_9ACTN|nr:sterol desaturase family protein [Cryptosporangium aurantiacum]SHM60182.1 Sterol desaturase/sphingolipid hydroxylase, fatty acid hydroxylase superfamily [Cryptosporangium aurantiacum]
MTEYVLVFAVPVFVLFLVLEIASYRFLSDESELGYTPWDTVTSLSMGLGFLVVEAGWKLVTLGALAGVYALTPLRLDPTSIWTWVLLFFADDLAYYWYHRSHHEVRILWASHVVHHSSQRYNFSTALRQPWTPFTALPFWLPLAAIGIPPWMIFFQLSVNLIYQFFLHTERIGTMPRWYEAVFNTPSHHRVHHGVQQMYLDRNYGGILIVWDRLFGTFEPEGERVVYGLTKNIGTYNPVKVAFSEYVAIGRALRTASSWRDRAGYLLRGPGWAPAVKSVR